jgi:ABC-type transport system substrate-binding protein
LISLNTTKPPFNDARVRQALSRGLNRLAARSALFAGQGDYDQLMPPGYVDRALKVKDMGPAAVYWDYNVAEAKKLLAAAGFASGFETSAVYTPQYGDTYKSELEEAIGDWAQIGVKIQSPQSIDYAQWISSVYRPPFKFDGILWGTTRSYPDPEPYLWYFLSPDGISNHGRINDPQITSLLEKQRATLNVDERWKVLDQIELMVANQQYYVCRNTGAANTVIQPWVKNFGTHIEYNLSTYDHVWIDRS